MTVRSDRCCIVVSLLWIAGCAGGRAAPANGQPADAVDRAQRFTATAHPDDREPLGTSIPGRATPLVSRPIPGGTLDGRPIAPFYMAATEVTWDEYLALVTETGDSASAGPVDGFARPSRPYISMDRGFGQQDRPVISVSPKGAETYAAWLAARTGMAWRLPSVDEWRFAATLAAPGDTSALDRSAWHHENSPQGTRPVGTAAPDALGLYDLLGNAAEWCRASDGSYRAAGGSYRDPAASLGPDLQLEPSAAWNASDPQIPKSVWWLADAGFTGIRLVH